jgi:hypothetical protein
MTLYEVRKPLLLKVLSVYPLIAQRILHWPVSKLVHNCSYLDRRRKHKCRKDVRHCTLSSSVYMSLVIQTRKQVSVPRRVFDACILLNSRQAGPTFRDLFVFVRPSSPPLAVLSLRGRLESILQTYTLLCVMWSTLTFFNACQSEYSAMRVAMRGPRRSFRSLIGKGRR